MTMCYCQCFQPFGLHGTDPGSNLSPELLFLSLPCLYTPVCNPVDHRVSEQVPYDQTYDHSNREIPSFSTFSRPFSTQCFTDIHVGWPHFIICIVLKWNNSRVIVGLIMSPIACGNVAGGENYIVTSVGLLIHSDASVIWIEITALTSAFTRYSPPLSPLSRGVEAFSGIEPLHRMSLISDTVRELSIIDPTHLTNQTRPQILHPYTPSFPSET